MTTKVLEINQYDLSKAISVKKKKMIELGLTYGLTDERTIKCSQQLDALLNKLTNKESVLYYAN